MDERYFAEHAAERRVQQVGELRIGDRDGTQRLIKPERIFDAISRKGVDHEPLLVGGIHFLRWRFQVEDALVDRDHGIDQRDLRVQPRLGYGPHRLTKADHDGLMRLIDAEEGAIGEQQSRDGENGKYAAGKTEPHGWAPCGRRVNSFKGRMGTTPPPPVPAPSTMILSVPPNSRSIVSR